MHFGPSINYMDLWFNCLMLNIPNGICICEHSKAEHETIGLMTDPTYKSAQWVEHKCNGIVPKQRIKRETNRAYSINGDCPCTTFQVSPFVINPVLEVNAVKE